MMIRDVLDMFRVSLGLCLCRHVSSGSFRGGIAASRGQKAYMCNPSGNLSDFFSWQVLACFGILWSCNSLIFDFRDRSQIASGWCRWSWKNLAKMRRDVLILLFVHLAYVFIFSCLVHMFSIEFLFVHAVSFMNSFRLIGQYILPLRNVLSQYLRVVKAKEACWDKVEWHSQLCCQQCGGHGMA